jgi:hypothetical protein
VRNNVEYDIHRKKKKGIAEAIPFFVEIQRGNNQALSPFFILHILIIGSERRREDGRRRRRRWFWRWICFTHCIIHSADYYRL